MNQDHLTITIHLVLTIKYIYSGIFVYRSYTDKISIFKQQGPLQIIHTLQALSLYILFKKVYQVQIEFILAHLLIFLLYQIIALLSEKQFAQVVYQITILVQFSFYVQQMTEESIQFVCTLIQFAQLLYQIYLMYHLIKHKNSDIVTPKILILIFIESIVWIIVSFADSNIKIMVGVLQLCFLALVCRIYFELTKKIKRPKME